MNIRRVNVSHRLAILGAIALLALFAAACSSTRPASEQIDDAAITATIKGKFAADPDINPFNIDVDTMEGRVRLSGQVDDDFTREEAERLAEATKGVLSVDNDVTVGDKTAKQSMTDAEILAKVKSKLAADPEINPFNLDVDVEEGVVTLTGRVAKRQAKEEAGRLAQDTEGVRDVRNQVKVGDRNPDRR